MKRDEVFNLVKNIFIDIFKVDPADISDATSTIDIKNWDSLNHVILLDAVEDEFKIQFPLGEMMYLTSVREIVDSSMMKINDK